MVLLFFMHAFLDSESLARFAPANESSRQSLLMSPLSQLEGHQKSRLQWTWATDLAGILSRESQYHICTTSGSDELKDLGLRHA